MTKITKPKHSILANRQKEQPCPQALEQITRWFEKRDYSFVKTLEDMEYRKELELRLLIIQNLVQLSYPTFFIKPLSGYEHSIWKHSCRAGNPKLSEYEGSFYATRRELNANLVYIQKADDTLILRHAIAKELNALPPAPPENATLDEINKHSEELSTALKRQEYLCPLKTGDYQMLLAVDLTGTPDEISREIKKILIKAREELGIADKNKKLRKSLSLSPFRDKHALQYLDLLIYCIHPEEYLLKQEDIELKSSPYKGMTLEKAKQKSNHEFLRPTEYWNLTDNQIAQLIDPIELDSERIKEWRQETFEPKLLNCNYMRKYLLTLETENTP